MRFDVPVIAAVVALAGPAAAQTAAEQAAAQYQTGLAAFRAGDFATALEAFQKAYVLDPSPILVYNLARTYEEMGDARKAVEYFELYLVRQPDAPDRADVETRIRVTRKMLEKTPAQGTLAVETDPAGATVYVDGARQAGGTPLEVAPGVHTLRVEQPGYAADSREVRVAAAGRETVSVHLVPLAAPDEGGWRRPVAYGALAGAAVGLGLAGYFYASASHAADQASGLRGELDLRHAYQDDFDSARLGMWLSAGGALLLAGVGTTLLLTGPDAPAPSATTGALGFAW